MPTIYKPKKRYSIPYKKHDKQGLIQKIYNSSTWQKLRNSYLMEHPLCENCLLLNKVTPAKEVHHDREISNGNTLEEMQDIAFNPDNLIALCVACHHEIHTNRRRNRYEKNKRNNHPL